MSTLLMRWSPRKQLIRFDNREFHHNGPIATDPSHDLAHLLVAANGALDWAPEGEIKSIKLAEYNAVMLEHFLNFLYETATMCRTDEPSALQRSASHGRWFVEKHFAPFPISAKKAFEQFRGQLSRRRIVNLCPLYFRQKKAERSDSDFKVKTWIIEADLERVLPGEDSDERRFVRMVRRQLRILQYGDLQIHLPSKTGCSTDNDSIVHPRGPGGR